MNSISIHGKIVGKPEQVLIRTPVGETPLIKFKLMDLGLSFQKTEPMIIEVHFLKEGASSLFNFLVPDKEVNVIGYLRKIKVERMAKLVISADYITLLPMYDKSYKVNKTTKTHTEE